MNKCPFVVEDVGYLSGMEIAYVIKANADLLASRVANLFAVAVDMAMACVVVVGTA